MQLFGFLAFACLLSACGNKFDVDTEYGRRALIIETNVALSRNECQKAMEAIDKLYTSKYVNEEVRILKSSVYACFAGFRFFKLLSNFGNVSGDSGLLGALAKSMPGTLGDGKIENMYSAVDVLMEFDPERPGEVKEMGEERSSVVNTFMIFLQLGVIGANLHRYGNADDETGVKGNSLSYNGQDMPTAIGELSNIDACALSASFGVITDSIEHSSLGESTNIDTALGAVRSVCDSTGLPDCGLHKLRNACTGGIADQPSINTRIFIISLDGTW